MNKADYLDVLKDYLLQYYSEEESLDILRDYEEYFLNGKLDGKTEEEIAKEDGFSSGRKGRREAAFCNEHTGITGWDGNGKAGRKTEKERTPVQQEAHRRTLRNRGQSCHDSLPFESGLQTGRQRVGPFLSIS